MITHAIAALLMGLASLAFAQTDSVGGYSCEQQASWGKCGEPWMHPDCSHACRYTVGVGGYSCEQQASWGKCGEPWMHPICSQACGATQPRPRFYSCQDLASWGYCSEPRVYAACGLWCSPRYPDRAWPSGGDRNPNGLIYPNLGAGFYYDGRYYYYHPGGYSTGGLVYPNLGVGYYY